MQVYMLTFYYRHTQTHMYECICVCTFMHLCAHTLTYLYCYLIVSPHVLLGYFCVRASQVRMNLLFSYFNFIWKSLWKGLELMGRHNELEFDFFQEKEIFFICERVLSLIPFLIFVICDQVLTFLLCVNLPILFPKVNFRCLHQILEFIGRTCFQINELL